MVQTAGVGAGSSMGNAPPEILRRQQGGGGIMIWAGIVNDRIIGPFKVDDGVKMNSANYTAF